MSHFLLFFSDQRDDVFKLTLRTFWCNINIDGTMEQRLADILRHAFEGKKNSLFLLWVLFFLTLFTLL